jgi:hypothetical protein
MVRADEYIYKKLNEFFIFSCEPTGRQRWTAEGLVAKLNDLSCRVARGLQPALNRLANITKRVEFQARGC